MHREDFQKGLKGKRVVVVGMARTGMVAAEFLSKMGADVIVTEMKAADELGTSPDRLRSLGVEVELGGHSPQTFLRRDLIVISPGVDPSIPPLEEARLNGIPVVSEIEFASWYLCPPLIAVTGTNGKSTTTSLIGHILSHGGKKVFVGGNIGTPLTEYLLQEREEVDYIVAEISSFHLEAIWYFRPWIALLLNLDEDHLDRHPTFSSYAEAKGRIFLNQGSKDWSVVNIDDATIRILIPETKAQLLPFGRERGGERGIWLGNEGVITYRGEGDEERFSLERLKIIGMHNAENIMAAVGAAKICGIPREVIQESLESFPGLEHRLESVGEWKGIHVYNDSKATNVASTLKALMSLKKPIILLAGGRDKGGDYYPLRGVIKERVKALILIGEAKEKMNEALGDLVPTYLVKGMEEGVHAAWDMARDGDVVLLSPACASFDMFQDFRERGITFKEIVLGLARKQG
ncbi:MAG: UDP-N-acetylmuramoyl-L-alanine--D-glutamate ligase [Deltaproteobacteria bacterium]|nr:MAG: UDP-N-acetylmuramoyl-L-alanine--D-glutamate ligase [Deltaproteobacteria bacterium]